MTAFCREGHILYQNAYVMSFPQTNFLDPIIIMLVACSYTEYFSYIELHAESMKGST